MRFKGLEVGGMDGRVCGGVRTEAKKRDVLVPGGMESPCLTQ